MSRFKIGIISDWLKMPFRQSMETCAKLGADGVQIYAVDGEMAPENMTKDNIKEKRDIIKSNGLEISALCGDLGGHGFEKRDENPKKIEKSKRIVDLGLELGTNIVTTHIGVVPQDTNSDTYKIMQEACNELAEYAYDKKAYFAIETGPETAQRLAQFLKGLDSPGVAVNFDPANLVMVTGDDPIEAVHTLKDYIVHTHAKDGVMLKQTDPKVIYNYFATGGIGDLRLEDYFKETAFGEGDVNFDKWLAALREVGYVDYLTIERELGENPLEDIELAVNYLKNHPLYNI